MRLIRHGEPGDEKPGIMIGNVRFDLSAFFVDWNREFFNRNGISKLRDRIANDMDRLQEVPQAARWAAPVARPGSIICIGLNYSDHAKESGMEVPKEPILFMKATNTIAGPFDNIMIPPGSVKTDWEVELGIVVNRDCYRLASVSEGSGAIAGYTIVHDISEREYQLERGGQWVKGKSCPGFSPMGPYLVTPEEIADPLQLNMELKVNEKIMQKGDTSTMVFGPAYLVWYISQFMQLEAGDVISTGTPPGVGLGMQPPQYLKAGDLVEMRIDHLGMQKQRFVSWES